MDKIFRNYLIEEFAEDYQEGHLTRRQALKLIAGVTGSFLVAGSILAACAPAPDETQIAATVDAATEAPSAGATAPPSMTAPAATTTAQSAAPATAAATAMPATLDAAQPTAAVETPLIPPAAGTVAADDPAVTAAATTFSGEDGAQVMGYLARPASGGSAPVILVCHENRGLTPHIQDVARRLAKAGYVALAVDLLSRQGGTEAVGSDNVPGVLGNTPSEQFVADFRSGWRSLGQGDTAAAVQLERVGMVGFCFGGGVTWLVATQMPELKAAAPFYGPHPPVEAVPNIQAAVRAIYAGEDERINAGIPAIEAAMQENGKVYEKIIYPGAQHAFHNDTSPRYNAEAAKDAWAKTLEWFAQWV